MERKVPFTKDEYYHIYSRGVEKRKIFISDKDRERFIALLYILNQKDSFNLGNFLKNKKINEIFSEDRGEKLVGIVSYCLMPNHFHILICENIGGGISKFMSRLLTAYSMYFNIKFERSGPLFVRPFRSQHVSLDAHYAHLFNYIHFNPVKLAKSRIEAKDILENYTFSSYKDFVEGNRPETKILDLDLIPEDISRTPLDINDYEQFKDIEYTD